MTFIEKPLLLDFTVLIVLAIKILNVVKQTVDV